jgi:hypothetical protein
LEPGVGIIHDGGWSEFFREQHSHDQVGEAKKGDEADDEGFHVKKTAGSADFRAEACEGEGDRKEHSGEQREQDVGHADIIAQSSRAG